MPARSAVVILGSVMRDALGFVLEEWEIWRQYTTYLIDPLPQPDEIALRLVRSGVTICSRIAGGAIFWKQNGLVASAQPVIEIEQNGIGTWSLPTGVATGMDPFILEGLHQSAWFEASEVKVFVAPGEFPAPYVRGFLGECVLQGNGRCFQVYPIVKIYMTGVVQVLIRIISPERSTPLDVFVREYWHASSHRFDNVLAPVGLVKARMRQDVDDQRVLPRASAWGRRRIRRQFSELLEDLTTESQSGDFSFELAPLFIKGVSPTLSASGKAVLSPSGPPEKGYTLSELAETITGAVAYSLGEPRTMRCRKPLRLGSHWIGRPHIYLTKHHDQRETAKENEEAHGAAFGCILAGVIADSKDQALHFLPESSRTFEDYGLYVIKQATLVVWAGSGLRKLASFADANRAHLIYEQHVLAEAMDYGYILHQKTLELALSAETTSQAFKAREDLIKLRRTLTSASPFGELQELLEAGWKEMGTDATRELASEALETRGQANELIENRRASKWRFLVTAIFGVLALLGIAGQVLKPLWKWRSWPLPSNPHLADLSMVAAALVLVGCVVLLAWICVIARRPHR